MLDRFDSLLKKGQKLFFIIIVSLSILSAGIGVLMGLRKANKIHHKVFGDINIIEPEIKRSDQEIGEDSGNLLPSPILPESVKLNTDFIYYFDSIYKEPGIDNIIEIDINNILEDYGVSLKTVNSGDEKNISLFRIGNKKYDILMYRKMIIEP